MRKRPMATRENADEFSRGRRTFVKGAVGATIGLALAATCNSLTKIIENTPIEYSATVGRGENGLYAIFRGERFRVEERTPMPNGLYQTLHEINSEKNRSSQFGIMGDRRERLADLFYLLNDPNLIVVKNGSETTERISVKDIPVGTQLNLMHKSLRDDASVRGDTLYMFPYYDFGH